MIENPRYLSKELVSLIHNIELNRSGWWDIALQRLVIGAIWLSDEDLTCHQIADFLESMLHISIDRHRILSQVDILCKQKTLIPISDKEYRLTESTKLDFEEEIAKAESISQHAESEFKKIISHECPELSPERVWVDLNNNLFIPAIKQMGAKFYEFITGKKSDFEGLIVFNNFLQCYPASHRKPLQSAVTQYLSRKDNRVRSFILRQLYTSLVIEANHLDEETIKKFSQTNKKRLSFKIFADTNFIFSLFGVHDNPFNEDANTLTKLIQSLSDSLNAKLYITTITVEETRQAIQNSIDYYNYLRLSPNLANASLKLPNLGGFLRKLSIEAAKSGQTLTAQDFYGPYKTDLIRILRAHGIELYNTDLSKYKTEQDVIDDILAQIQFEEEKYGGNAKSYEKAQHDIILWHFIDDNRPAIIESPSDAAYWIVTVDFRFLGFDYYKKRFDGNSVPICVLPSQLIQLLQFWVPRTPQFEEALFESWLWPLLFQELDKEAEEVTVKILNALSRYENINDLPEEVISQILFNNALRQRIAPENSIREQVKIVELALIESHKKVSEELDTTKKKTEKQQTEILQLHSELSDKEKSLLDKRNEANEKEGQIQDLSTKLQHIQSENESLHTRIDSIQELLQRKEETKRIDKTRNTFVAQAIGYLLLAIAFSTISTTLTQKSLALSVWQVFIGFFAIAMIGWTIAIDKIGRSKEYVINWDIFIRFKKLKKWLFTALSFIFLAILESAVGDLLWESLKNLFPKTVGP